MRTKLMLVAVLATLGLLVLVTPAAADEHGEEPGPGPDDPKLINQADDAVAAFLR